ncbi:unnamed protein product [Allacma fusca]|uniref:LanC-like protein 3 homolog n=1 Tax=Allacma fusca TaxID=39272 RepID=A0A8J2PVI0_9HEXA|nr:unnamed protein product [Allacma fusca]
MALTYSESGNVEEAFESLFTSKCQHSSERIIKCCVVFLTVIMSSDVRYFNNPFQDFGDLNSRVPPVNKQYVKDQLIDLARVVFSKQKHECHGGLYTGAAGLTYSFLHIQSVLTEQENRYFLPLAEKLYQRHEEYFQELGSSLREKDLPGFIHGKAGVDAVGAVLGKVTGNKKLFETSTRNYAAAADICKPRNFQSKGSDELFVGRGGYLLGVLWLQEKLGYQPVPIQDVKDVWDATIRSGRKYATAKRSPCRLMYAYHDKEYLGAAHGLSSILQVLLSFPEFLKQDPKAEADIKNTIDYYLTLQDKNGNYPSSTGKVGPYNLVHWCHGATGAAFMFAKAYLTFGDRKYLNACISCGDCIWRFGLLKKGPGICHGVAGNGYVFLLLHRLLQEDTTNCKNLYRAGKFAEFLKNDIFIQYARTPDRPYSLYEGLAGTLCFLADLLHPGQAEYPFFNVFYNYLTA